MIARHRISADVTTIDMYRLFNKDHSDLKVSRDKFAQVLKAVNHSILDIVISGHDIQLPWGLGLIGIRALPPKYDGLMIDHGETNKLKKKYPDKNYKVYMTNEHTNGKVVKFLWLKENKAITNKQYFTIDFTRPKNRELAARLKNPDIANNYYDFISWKQKLNQQTKWPRSKHGAKVSPMKMDLRQSV